MKNNIPYFFTLPFTDCTRVINVLSPQLIDLFESKTILITGSTGLLGSYIIALFHLISRFSNIKVTCCHSSPLPKVYEYLTYDPSLTFNRIDLTNPQFILPFDKYDYIFHFAGCAQPQRFLVDPISTLLINTTATSNLCTHLSEDGFFIFASSSEVYCGLTSGPFSESQVGSANSNHPRSSYIYGKLAGESIIYNHNQLFPHSSHLSVRLADIYGPFTKARDTRAINEFIYRSLTNKSLQLRDAGLSVRTYCYASDFLLMLFSLIVSKVSGIYNIGSNITSSVHEIASVIASITNVPLSVPSVTDPVIGSPSDLTLNLSKYEDLLGQPAFTSLQHGLEKTITWQKSVLYSN